jgi:hypothetical protein
MLMVNLNRRPKAFRSEAEGDWVVFPFRLLEWADLPFQRLDHGDLVGSLLLFLAILDIFYERMLSF